MKAVIAALLLLAARAPATNGRNIAVSLTMTPKGVEYMQDTPQPEVHVQGVTSTMTPKGVEQPYSETLFQRSRSGDLDDDAERR